MYEPRGAALDLFRKPDRSILLDGPAGTGKTRAILEYIHIQLLRHRNARAAICRATRASMTQSVLVEFETNVLHERSPARFGPSRATRQSYNYPNGSELWVGGLDHPERIMSTQYDIIAVFEATEIKWEAYDNLLSRLRNYKTTEQQILCDCNPREPTHWLNQLANTPDMTRLLSRHEDNPVLHDGTDWTEKGRDYLSRLEMLSGARKERLRYGRWTQQEGVVYRAWDRARHCIEHREIPKDWRRIRAIDFGYTNPFVCQWWAIGPDDRMYLYREWAAIGTLVRDAAAEIHRLTGDERIDYTVADHDAEDRATLLDAGIPTIAARKEIEPGVQAVEEMLGADRLCILESALVSRPREFADGRKPCGVLEEIEGYVWAPQRKNHNEPEHPLKVNDHSMDAMRYAVMAETQGPNRIIFPSEREHPEPAGMWIGGESW